MIRLIVARAAHATLTAAVMMSAKGANWHLAFPETCRRPLINVVAMTRLHRTCTILGIALIAATPLQSNDDPLHGFSPENAVRQHALEEQFDASLNASNLSEWMQRLTARPQHVGSPQAKANAEFLAGLFRDWGYDAEIVRYDVLFPKPRLRKLELLAPMRFTALLDEPPVEGDASSAKRDGMLPPFNAYSADGDVTAEVVYVNYGIPDDYEELERRGIDVAGKIVIARYGGSWRGIKPKVAAEHGAIGCILYSDPRDDGYMRGDVYPEGPFRNKNGAQRGSVADMPLFPGDPLTPGIGATADAERLPVEEAPTIMKIPVLPISYGDAEPILRELAGPVAPAAWRGALPLTYHIGPGPARVRLQLAFEWDLEPAYNVIARLEGDTYPDEWVIRGNHRDAWVFGAADPTSGTVAMLEEARAIGLLARNGSRPKRTIVYASWDAEEPGLLGSTEWVEHHADELLEKAAAYINTDGNGRGFLNIGGSHTLEHFADQVARDVKDPQTGVSVRARRNARLAVNSSSAATDLNAPVKISPLGSGSDYTPFLQHLGIASLNISYGGENSGGSYHSTYDTFEHYSRFGDPGFAYGIALAKTAGRATLRLANADVLPLRFANFASTVASYVDEVDALAESLRKRTVRENKLVESGAHSLAADPTETYVAPQSKEPVPFLSLAPIRNAMEELKAAAEEYDSALSSADPEQAASSALDAALMQTERAMTDAEGLPRRAWFRHQIYAPGFYTGYGVKTLPAVREAIEQRDWAEAEREITDTAATLGRVADAIREAAAQIVTATKSP